MDAKAWNGEPEREHDPGSLKGRGEPEPWKCLDCPAAGRGWVKRSRHWYDTQHRIVWAKDPRAKDAPRTSTDPDPEPHCMSADGQGRR